MAPICPSFGDSVVSTLCTVVRSFLVQIGLSSGPTFLGYFHSPCLFHMSQTVGLRASECLTFFKANLTKSLMSISCMCSSSLSGPRPVHHSDVNLTQTHPPWGNLHLCFHLVWLFGSIIMSSVCIFLHQCVLLQLENYCKVSNTVFFLFLQCVVQHFGLSMVSARLARRLHAVNLILPAGSSHQSFFR